MAKNHNQIARQGACSRRFAPGNLIPGALRACTYHMTWRADTWACRHVLVCFLSDVAAAVQGMGGVMVPRVVLSSPPKTARKGPLAPYPTASPPAVNASSIAKATKSSTHTSKAGQLAFGVLRLPGMLQHLSQEPSSKSLGLTLPGGAISNDTGLVGAVSGSKAPGPSTLSGRAALILSQERLVVWTTAALSFAALFPVIGPAPLMSRSPLGARSSPFHACV